VRDYISPKNKLRKKCWEDENTMKEDATICYSSWAFLVTIKRVVLPCHSSAHINIKCTLHLRLMHSTNVHLCLWTLIACVVHTLFIMHLAKLYTHTRQSLEWTSTMRSSSNNRLSGCFDFFYWSIHIISSHVAYGLAHFPISH